MPIQIVSSVRGFLEPEQDTPTIRTGFETYLPWAAKELHISSDPADYLEPASTYW